MDPLPLDPPTERAFSSGPFPDPGGDGAAPQPVGPLLHRLVEGLLPIRSSITGAGLRRVLDYVDAMLGPDLSLERHEVPSGTPVLDWTVPPEWRVGEAWIEDALGQRVVDAADHPLHLVGYSEGVDAVLTLEALKEHLHTDPAHPDWIPYRTRYWAPGWGFCLRHRTLEAMERGEHPGPYAVFIAADRAPGALSYGELLLPGEREDEILLSAHTCHPGLANDNATGLVVAAALARALAGRSLQMSYRFVFAPGTIGAITWLDRNREGLDRIAGGLVLANLGDPGPTVYKRSRPGTLGDPTPFDRIVRHALGTCQRDWQERPFRPLGYDERQYGSPGFDLPVGRLSHTPWGEYPEYHTSADDARLVTPEALEAALATLLKTVETVEAAAPWRATQPYGEPQLGQRGLYDQLGGRADAGDHKRALLWSLNLADGRHTLLDVAQRAGLPLKRLQAAAQELAEADLLVPAPWPRPEGPPYAPPTP